MSQPSIRRTLLIRCGGGVGLLLFLLSAGVYLMVRQSLYRELDASIIGTAALLSNQVELENDRIAYEWQEGLGTNKALQSDDYFQFWEDASSGTSRSPALRFRDLPRFTGIDGQPLMRDIILPDGSHGRAVGMRIHPFVLADEIEAMKQRGHVIDPKSLPLTLVVAEDAEPIRHTLNLLRAILGAGTALTLAIGFVLVNRVVRTTLKPIDDLADQVKDRASHQLDAALEMPGTLPVELSGLAENFDLLLGRVAAIRQREKDFVRHAAHELRTPIAGLQATTELALSQPRDAASYAAYLATCRTTASELGELVKRLSALARVGRTLAPPSRVTLDLPALLKSCLTPFEETARSRDLGMVLDLPDEPLAAIGDAALLRIILNNLADNAVSYATPGTVITISATRKGDMIQIAFSNQVGEPIENPDRLFEPLFRRDPSRNDSGSHLGVGLTLSLEAAQAMDATLSARMTGSHTITFEMRIPAAGGGPCLLPGDRDFRMILQGRHLELEQGP